MPEDSLKRSRSPENDNDGPNKRPNKTSTSGSVTATETQPASSSMASSSEPPNAAADNSTAAPSADASQPQTGTDGANGTPPVPPQNIHMRCLIVTTDASVIIGRGGSHVNEIRDKSGAKVMVSESIPGNPERILNVNGPLDAVSKVSFRFFTIRSSCGIRLIT